MYANGCDHVLPVGWAALGGADGELHLRWDEIYRSEMIVKQIPILGGTFTIYIDDLPITRKPRRKDREYMQGAVLDKKTARWLNTALRCMLSHQGVDFFLLKINKFAAWDRLR